MQETWVQSLGREDPLEKKMATHSKGHKFGDPNCSKSPSLDPALVASLPWASIQSPVQLWCWVEPWPRPRAGSTLPSGFPLQSCPTGDWGLRHFMMPWVHTARFGSEGKSMEPITVHEIRNKLNSPEAGRCWEKQRNISHPRRLDSWAFGKKQTFMLFSSAQTWLKYLQKGQSQDHVKLAI